MALYKLKDFDPDYRSSFGNQNIVGFDLYSGNEKIGSVNDLLVDESGKFRYFVINTGIWIFGKHVLLPVGRARISETDRRVYADGLTRDQVEHLPEYKDDMTVDYDQEERVRNVYRSSSTSGLASGMAAGSTAAIEQSAPLEQPITSYNESITTSRETMGTSAAMPATYDRDTYSYDRDADLYDLNEQDHQTLRLYEERLIANKSRQKTGEVTIGKHVETETARVAVPVEKERVVIERVSPTRDVSSAIDSGVAFQEGEVVRMEVYEETPEIRKEAFVREEVSVRKEVERETVEAQETLRREQLDVDTDGNPIIDNPSQFSR